MRLSGIKELSGFKHRTEKLQDPFSSHYIGLYLAFKRLSSQREMPFHIYIYIHTYMFMNTNDGL